MDGHFKNDSSVKCEKLLYLNQFLESWISIFTNLFEIFLFASFLYWIRQMIASFCWMRTTKVRDEANVWGEITHTSRVILTEDGYNLMVFLLSPSKLACWAVHIWWWSPFWWHWLVPHIVTTVVTFPIYTGI